MIGEHIWFDLSQILPGLCVKSVSLGVGHDRTAPMLKENFQAFRRGWQRAVHQPNYLWTEFAERVDERFERQRLALDMIFRQSSIGFLSFDVPTDHRSVKVLAGT